MVPGGSDAFTLTVKAELTGERFDLETLSEIFADGEPRVFVADDNFWVQSTRLGGFATEQGGRQDDADELRDLLNGAGRLHAPGFRAVGIRSEYVISGPDGLRQAAVFVTATGEARARGKVLAGGIVTTPDGEEVETSSEAQKTQDLVALAVSNPLVGEVLGWLAQPTLDWAVMWKIYEIIRSDVGGQEALFAAQLAEKTAVKAFTASANRPDVSGPSARHARLPGGRPSEVMALGQGQEFVRTLVRTWMRRLVLSHEGSCGTDT